jgi:hypothetical protein
MRRGLAVVLALLSGGGAARPEMSSSRRIRLIWAVSLLSVALEASVGQ